MPEMLESRLQLRAEKKPTTLNALHDWLTQTRSQTANGGGSAKALEQESFANLGGRFDDAYTKKLLTSRGKSYRVPCAHIARQSPPRPGRFPSINYENDLKTRINRVTF